MATRSRSPRRFLSSEEVRQVEAAIAEAERGTSGQIKVVLARHCWVGLRRKSQRLFRRFGLDRTSRRNCAMVLLITTNRQFCIYGDRGIHQHVGSEFWTSVRDAMQQQFRTGEFTAGLCAGVREIGRHLAEHFPSQEQADELPNHIDYSA